MAEFIPWSSQPLDEWAEKYAAGKFVKLDGYSTHYLEKGEGEPVILIHGFIYDSYMWNKNIDALADRFKVYALDLWGFGYSTREPMDYGYPLYADQLLKFMDALNIQKASLVGQSMGGGTSILFSVRHRDRVNKVILVAPAGMPNPLPLMGKLANLPRVGEFLIGLKSNFYRKMILSTTFFYDKGLITDSYIENVTRFHKIKGSNEVFLKILRKQFFPTLPDEVRRLGEMDVPILIILGRQDKAVPLARGQEMHKILKGSRLEIFERAGHCPHDEQPEKFNQLAVDFLSSN
ncbi:MAG: alpha/beta fold hydrolase [Deltaproteobacteria bacterium]|nr:MAG: alpha/beta fold hydrolase [Deltaproteobacteria bacterium]